MHDMLDTVILISLDASKKILDVYHTDFSFESKDDNSPLTLADTASNELIINRLREACPNIPILSEESTESVPYDTEYCWIVDPLDGTKEFIKKNGEFTVNIALVHNHIPILGVIAVPVSGIVYFASKGNGAYKLQNNVKNAIYTSNKTEDLILVGSKSHSTEKESDFVNKNRHRIKKMISAGSSLKGTMVAEGKADIYYRFGLTCEWDTCAMHCIVEEAGGVFHQMDNTEMVYNRKNHLNEKGFYVVNRKENIWV